MAKVHHFKIMDDVIYLNYDAGEFGEREATFYMPLNWIGSNLTKKEKKIEGEIAELENRKRYPQVLSLDCYILTRCLFAIIIFF